MSIRGENNLKLYINEDFEKKTGGLARHFFTTRYGGVSGPQGDLMNVSFGKDSREKVLENVKILAAARNFDYQRLTGIRQVHGDRVVKIDGSNAGARFSKPEIIEEADAMITDCPGVTLMTTHGDCVPVYLWDSENRAIGVIHSGWRGTVSRISAKTVEAMMLNYGTQPEKLAVLIGPGICPKCFEVHLPVAEKFYREFGTESSVVRKHDAKEGKYNVNLKAAIFETLAAAGVKNYNIIDGGMCTACVENSGLFFSHRREKGENPGLMGAFFEICE